MFQIIKLISLVNAIKATRLLNDPRISRVMNVSPVAQKYDQLLMVMTNLDKSSDYIAKYRDYGCWCFNNNEEFMKGH